jgi:streptogramin lyase/GH25 family lysozyme M1 (1,4-beta-N-acetylmuramidase)
MGRPAVQARVVRVLAAAAVATTALAPAVLPAHATSIDEFSAGISSPGDQITYGADGNVWFTEPASPNKIARITLAGAVTEYTSGLTLNAGLSGITAGPDGNVWFAEATAGKIGRITPSGVVTEFAAAAGGSPTGIAAGRDGNLWFTEPRNGGVGSDAIGRMSPTGVLSTFTTGLTNGSTPTAITAGPDGNLWFTEQSGGRIGRVTIAGVITEFAAGLSPQNLQAIASGPDGNLWVTESSANDIVRVTTSGVATHFSSGITGSSEPAAVTAGPDGAVWFTESSGDRIASINPNGVVTEFASGISPASGPNGIVMGPDLNLWFTESAGARIGRVLHPGRQGLDVSSFQGAVNWTLVAGAGYSFGYARIGDGSTLPDADFAANWAGMRTAGILRGAYLFYEPNQDPTAQALALEGEAAYGPPDLIPVFDVEVTDSKSAAVIISGLQTAVARIKADLGVWPVIYTNYSFWFSTLGNPTTFSSDPLWIANWGVRSPLVPAANWGGNGWRIWQFSDTGVVPGVSGMVDLDQASWAGLPLMSNRGVAQSAAASPGSRAVTPLPTGSPGPR